MASCPSIPIPLGSPSGKRRFPSRSNATQYGERLHRYAVWLSDLAKEDARVLRGDADTRSDVDQFLRAVGSISANLAEGYSRRTGVERARYYDYARATAREAKDWYFKGRTALGEAVVEQRYAVLERIIRILTAVIPREREDGSRRHRRWA